MTVQGPVKEQPPDGMSHAGGGGGGLCQGTSSWGRVRFSLWCRNSHNDWLHDLGHFLLLVHPQWRRWPGSVVLLPAVRWFVTSVHIARALRCFPSLTRWCCLMSWCCSKSGPATECPQGTKGWGCRSFPWLIALHQHSRCVEVFPAEIVPRRNPPPTPHPLYHLTFGQEVLVSDPKTGHEPGCLRRWGVCEPTRRKRPCKGWQLE